MMAIIGLSAGNRILSSSFYYSDLTEKFCVSDHALPCHHFPSPKNVINAKNSSNYSPSYVSNRKKQSVKALKEHVDIASNRDSYTEPWVQMFKQLQNGSCSEEDSVEVLLLLQKSMLEKQWNLSAEKAMTDSLQNEKNSKKKMQITCSGTSARRRRMDTRKRDLLPKNSATSDSSSKRLRSVIGPELLQNRSKGYINGVVGQELLTHTEVVQLSKKIKFGLYLEEQKSRYRALNSIHDPTLPPILSQTLYETLVVKMTIKNLRKIVERVK